MSLRRLLIAPLSAFALVCPAELQAQAANSSATAAPAPALLAADNTAAAPIEPEALPGTVAEAPSSLPAPVEEPPLPVASEDDAVVALQAQEEASTPRRFRYELSVDVRGVYDDNVTLSSTKENRRDDFYTAVMPQVSAGLGDFTDRQENFVYLNYAPSGFFYFNNSDFSTIEQVGRLEAQWRLRRITLTLSQDFQSVQSSNLNVANNGGGFTNQTNLDVGGRRRINTYSTRVGASAPLTGKMLLRLDGTFYISDPEDLIGSENLAGSIGVDFIYGPKLTLGIGATAGRQWVDEPSPDTTFEQVNVRATYELSGKVNATGSAGVEFRQSDDGSQNNHSPIFQLGIAYAPFEATQVDLSATRRTQNSASAFGQDFTSTQLVLTARQRFVQRVFFSISLGVQNQTYFSTATGVQTDRDDNYYFIAPGIDVRITEFWFAGVFYTHRENDSSLPFFSFDDNQYGIRTTLTF